MSLENLFPTITSIGGSFVAGIMLGYFVKKIIKILMFVVGGIIGLLLYLQQQQIISVNIEQLEHVSTLILNSTVYSFDNITQSGSVANLGIPLAGGLSAGLAIGFMKG